MSRAPADGTTRPELPLTDAEREILAELLAELLVVALGDGEPEAAR